MDLIVQFSKPCYFPGETLKCLIIVRFIVVRETWCRKTTDYPWPSFVLAGPAHAQRSAAIHIRDRINQHKRYRCLLWHWARGSWLGEQLVQAECCPTKRGKGGPFAEL